MKQMTKKSIQEFIRYVIDDKQFDKKRFSTVLIEVIFS